MSMISCFCLSYILGVYHVTTVYFVFGPAIATMVEDDRVITACHAEGEDTFMFILANALTLDLESNRRAVSHACTCR